MKCRICGNVEHNRAILLKENQHGTLEKFQYFQCSSCECIQIADIPSDPGKYYPKNYFAFDPKNGDTYLQKDLGFFKRTQTDYLIFGRQPVLGRLFTIGYPVHRLIQWLRNMRLNKDAAVLDIGCGTGTYLKQMYQMGYSDLTGVDPFIERDYIFSGNFRILKRDPLEIEGNKKFDCIMMHHSFEHMVQEREVLEKAKELLKPGGTILVRIPIYSQPLMEKYGDSLVSLDAPRHIYVHSTKSMKLICSQSGLNVDRVVYDADAFSFWASEQYARGIILTDKNSYDVTKTGSIFTEAQIKEFKKEIKKLNEEGRSDAAAFYISAAG